MIYFICPILLYFGGIFSISEFIFHFLFGHNPFYKVFSVMSLELHRRYEIVFLTKHKHSPEFSINRIAKIINCNRSTVVRWLNRWDETKDLSDKRRIGRPRTTTTKQQDQIIINSISEGIDEGITSEQVEKQLTNENSNVNARTIRRRLNEAGFKYMKPLSKPLLTEHHQRKRLSWARLLINFGWNQVIASDETVFRVNDVRRFYWQRPGQRKVCRTVKYSMKINAWGCLSSDGFGRIICFKDNMTSTILCDKIYTNALIPSANKLFGQNEDHSIETLPWPSLSPDMNPVENVWALLKIKVSDRRFTSKEELIRAIKEEWRDLLQELPSNLMSDTNRRIDRLIEAKGDYTMYWKISFFVIKEVYT